MTVLENEIEIGRKKNTLGSYYEEAKKAIASDNVEQALDLTERGRIQAELENDFFLRIVSEYNAVDELIRDRS